VSAPDILANTSRGWNREPAGFSTGARPNGVSAALWTDDRDLVQEVGGTPDPSMHVVAWQLTSFSSETFYDGQLVHRGRHSPGTFNIVAAGIRPKAILRGPFKVLHAYVPTAVIAEAVDGLVSRAGEVELIDPRCAHDPEIERIGRSLLTEMQTGALLSRLRIDVLGLDLAIHLLRRHSNLPDGLSGPRVIAKGGLAPWQVRRVSDYLEAHLADDVSLADLGALLGLSTFHVCRAFKRSTGLPPHRWRHQRRMERGRELLESTNLPILEIAAAVGYADPGPFAAAFRKAFGLSPTDYRRERRS